MAIGSDNGYFPPCYCASNISSHGSLGTILVTTSTWDPPFTVKRLFWSGLDMYDKIWYKCRCYRINLIPINEFTNDVILIESVYLARYWLTGSRQHCTLKSYLLLVNLYIYLLQFRIKRNSFSFVFTTYIQLCTQMIELLFFYILFSSQLFNLTWKSRPTCSSAACPPFSKSPKNQWSSTINKSFNILRTKYQFSNNNCKIKLLFNWYM